MNSLSIRYPTVSWASDCPDQAAIVCDGISLTHAALEQRVVAAASRLIDLGVEPGDRIAVGAANSIEWVTLVHAVNRAGATLVPLNTRLTSHEVAERLALFEPRVVLGDDEFGAKRANTIPIQALAGSGSLEHGIAETTDPSAISTIVSTSGTSGQPKGVCLTLANHLAAAAASHENLHCGPGDHWLINLPLYHVGGLSIVYRAALCGFTMVIHSDFSPVRTLEAIRSESIAHLSLVETTLGRILELNGNRPFPDSVRAVLVGGGPVDDGLLRRARDLGLPVLPTYGLTEAGSQVATMRPSQPEAEFGIGVPPLPTCEIEIRDPAGRAVAAETEGEIWIRGPMVTAGYWTSGGEIIPATIDGWLPTGDNGLMSLEGLLSVRGRKDAMIISGGENIYPAEIERALTRLPGIRRAAVLGISDPEWGQVPVALVEIDDGATETPAQWAKMLRSHLAGFKIPRRIIPVPALLVTSLGKIERSSLPNIYRGATGSAS